MYKSKFTENLEQFHTTGIQNIDDTSWGLNFLKGGFSVGYLETEDRAKAEEIEKDADAIFHLLNSFERKYDVKIKLDIQMK